MNKRAIVTFAGIACIAILLLLKMNSCKTPLDKDISQANKTDFQNSKDWKDKEGKLNAEVEQLRLQNLDNLEAIKGAEELAKALREANQALKGKVQALTILNSQLRLSGKGKTSIEYVQVKVPTYLRGKDSLIFIEKNRVELKPIYNFHKTDEYADINISAASDSIAYEIQLKEKYNITTTKRHRGLFGLGGADYIVNVRSDNPYVDSLSVQSAIIHAKPKRFGLGLHRNRKRG